MILYKKEYIHNNNYKDYCGQKVRRDICCKLPAIKIYDKLTSLRYIFCIRHDY